MAPRFNNKGDIVSFCEIQLQISSLPPTFKSSKVWLVFADNHDDCTKVVFNESDNVKILQPLFAGVQYSVGKCLLREYDTDRKVCVCNKDTCDTLEPVKKIEDGSFVKFTSNMDGLRFEKEIGKFLKNDDVENAIYVHEQKEFQKIFGFGGAFSDATGINIMSLNEDVRNKLMKSYFSAAGIEYSIGRVPMAATDFSTHMYTYHDEEDINLANFSLAEEDYKYKIPLMQWASKLSNNKIKFLSSSWTTPKWMKENGEYSEGFLKENMYQIWANYYIKFFDAYQKEGVPIWAATTGNEPQAVTYGSGVSGLGWNTSLLKTWLSNNFGPTVRNSSHSQVKIMIMDDQREFLKNYTEEIFSDPEARKYADGVAVHWYSDKRISANELSDVHNKYPDKFIFGSEASEGSYTKQPVQLGLWTRAEEYAFDIIEDMNHWVTGWVDWNMALDLQGGPTYINNFCDAPILVNATAQEFLKQPMFYGIGHFSKFVPADSRRIGLSGTVDSIPVTAFKRPDGGIVVVLLNGGNSTLKTVVQDQKRGNILLNLSAHSLTTIVYW